MAIIAFWSDEKRETGQTLSMVAVSTYMAIEHNYKIIDISTNFKDNTLEDCFWNFKREKAAIANITGNTGTIGLESGIEGLIKVIRSNKTNPNIVANYSRVVFNNRLDVLCSPTTTDYKEYKEIAKTCPEIIQLANKNYDMVFVDISKRMAEEDVNKILEIADIIVVNITQRLTIIDKFLKLREENRFFKNNNVVLNIGRYDNYSKYNKRNIKRYLRMKRDVVAVPYNTLYFEGCSEGKTAEFFLRLRNLGPEDRNYVFINNVSKICKELIFKLQELQIRT